MTFAADVDPSPATGSGARHVAMVIQRFRPAFTGQGVQVEQLCRHLATRGIESTILTAVRGQPDEAEDCDGYRVLRLRCDVPGLAFTASQSALWMPAFGLRVLRRLTALRRSVDVVHVHALTDGLLGARAFGQLFDVPVVQEMTLLGDDDPLSVRRRRHRLQGIRWNAYAGCDAFVAMSDALAAAFREAGLPEERLVVIPQGVDTGRFRPPVGDDEVQSLRAATDLPPDAPVAAFVGSLIHRKGIDVLLAAWPQVRARVPDAHLMLVGRDRFPAEPAAESELRRALEALPDDDRASVRRLGLREDVHRVLRAADCFVFPSRREGFGSVIIEAMSTGLPCVVAELPGITDRIFDDGARSLPPPPASDGIVVPQEDPGALAAAVAHLLGDRGKARSLGERARRRACAAYDFEHVTDRYVDLYRRLETGS